MTHMDQLVRSLSKSYPEITFKQGSVFCWSPELKQVVYTLRENSDSATWSLFHETSHALLAHTSYGTDFELLSLEVDAWERAKELAERYGIHIDEDHIQDCLDSYRDWIYARSICPQCGNKSLQQADLKHYKCFNCRTIWQVAPSRFCRAYRATKRATALASFDALITLE